jgi:flagellar hook-associated protein 2
MVESIGFGTLSLANGAPRLSGTSSQLDTEALVSAVYEAKRLPAVRLETKIDRNEAKLAAFGELKELLGTLRSAANGLRNPPGLLGRNDNLFEAKTAFLAAASGAADPATILGVNVEPSATTGSFEVVVERLATAHKLEARSAAASDQSLAEAWNGGVGFAGDLELGLAGGEKVTIQVTGDMTLAELRDAVNATSLESGVSANLIQVAEGDVRLVLSGRETGKAIELADLGPDSVTALLGASDLVAAQTAQIRVDGIAIERTGNRIDDVLDGVVLDLYAAEPGAAVTVTVENDVAGVKAQIGAFVEAYNAVRDFLAKHSSVAADGQVAADAVLFGDRTLREIGRALASEVGGAARGLDADALATLRSIGITMGEGGKLRIDEAKLDSMLLTELDAVRGILEFRASSSSTELAVLARGNALASTSFEVEIVDADADGIIESATIGGIAAEVSGSRIIGAAGTEFAGLELAWVGEGSTTISVEVSQGVADRLYNLLDGALQTGTGSLARASEELGGINEDYRQEIARIDERADRARSQLVEKLTGMEAALSLANTLLSQVRAQMDAMAGSQ